jgi:hypothetical protein
MLLASGNYYSMPDNLAVFAAKFANVRAILAAFYSRTFARGSSG